MERIGIPYHAEVLTSDGRTLFFTVYADTLEDAVQMAKNYLSDDYMLVEVQSNTTGRLVIGQTSGTLNWRKTKTTCSRFEHI